MGGGRGEFSHLKSEVSHLSPPPNSQTENGTSHGEIFTDASFTRERISWSPVLECLVEKVSVVKKFNRKRKTEYYPPEITAITKIQSWQRTRRAGIFFMSHIFVCNVNVFQSVPFRAPVYVQKKAIPILGSQ